MSEAILVTGASRGIGRAVAVELGRDGGHVVLVYREADAAAEEAREEVLAAGAKTATLAKADVGSPDAVRTLIDRVLDEHERVDVLVNNAGVQRSALAHKMSDEQWQSVLDVNLSGPFYLSRAVLPGMLEAGRGRIVNIASASSFVGQKGAAGYVASKHGLIGLTKALALETAGKGILVNAVAPGLTETDLVHDLTDDQRERLLSMVPLRRIATPVEVAKMVRWVVHEVSYSTGSVFHVTGGVTMG